MGSQKKRPVRLTAADREELVRVTTTGWSGLDDQACAGAARAGHLGG